MTTPDDKTLDDLVRRLRDVTQTGGLPDDDYEVAADVIAALRERIAALEAALERVAFGTAAEWKWAIDSKEKP